MSARDTLLQSAKRRYLESSVLPGAFIRSVSLSEYQAWRVRPFDKEGKREARAINTQTAALFQLVLCSDEEGSQMFLESEIDQLAAVDAGLAERLLIEVENHIGTGEQAEDIEETVKNSEETPNVSLLTG